MSGIGKLLMILGAVVFVVGFLIYFFKLGKLPGDIVIKKGNTTFYFPIVTSILVSIILSLIFFFVGRWK
ncbi:DUF2905 domain-containing protein [Bacillus carboniphilus]|uniref:DUF2905 domain-containing protein n=1 Tax=Bacillus carboniphilus TaxID=86663 RepID=A0ABN0WE15_9BACI